MTSKKTRRYGDLSERPLPSDDHALIDDVFAAFTGPRPAPLSPVTDDSPSTGASPSIADSPTADASPSTSESPVKSAPLALSHESPITYASPSTDEQPKRRSRAEYRKGDSRTNHDFFDAELCSLPPMSQLLWFHLNRFRDRGSDLTVTLSWKKLADRFGLEGVSDSTARRAFVALERAGLAFKHRTVFGKGGEQGIVFRLFTLDSPSIGASPSTGDSNKRKDQKENLKGEVRCALCKDTGGWVYPDGPQGGVVKCDHRGGKS